MSDLNPILSSSAQSIEAYQQAIEQSTQAVMQWLKQPEMYQGKTVAELRERINLEFSPEGLVAPPGGAVVFSCSLLHSVQPVTRGRRFAFLPFLYDEAAAALRAENLRYFDDPDGVPA